MFASLLAFVLIQQSPLDHLQTRYEAAAAAKDFKAHFDINAEVFKLLEQDRLSNADDFYRAANLIADPQLDLEVSRVRHELALAASALGKADVHGLLRTTWDALQIAAGRGQRFGTIKAPGYDKFGQRFHTVPAAKSVKAVLENPGNAIQRARLTPSNAEITKIIDADQAVRTMDFSHMTLKQHQELQEGDRKRLLRIYKLLSDGKVVTSEDFDRASLVLQHGGVWADFAVAHELAICSVLLGNKRASWLASATYDRMLRSAGHPQRFGTQYGGVIGMPVTLQPVDTRGIGDAQRKAMGVPTLDEAKARKLG
ncbi:MAG: hypothetical protein HONBIEJF_02759 [Fimbriimonadaceae bacterium]|nr:hypothetical protein [Fimbriimonadaceae bacterium]